MIPTKYQFNNRQRQRIPSTDSSTSDDIEQYSPAPNEYVFTESDHSSNVCVIQFCYRKN